jgi:hypothetical protein
MRAAKLLLFACLLYCFTSCEKSAVVPKASDTKQQTTATPELANNTVTPLVYETTHYKYSDNKGTILLFAVSSKYTSYIRNWTGTYATVKPPVPPCYPNETNCPPRTYLINVAFSQTQRSYTVTIPNSPSSRATTWAIVADYSFLKGYTTERKSFYRVQ